MDSGNRRAKGRDAGEDFRGLEHSDGLFESGAGDVHTALNGGAGIDGDFREFPQDFCLKLPADHGEPGHLGGNVFDLARRKPSENLGRRIRAEDDEQCGQFLQAGETHNGGRRRWRFGWRRHRRHFGAALPRSSQARIAWVMFCGFSLTS